VEGGLPLRGGIIIIFYFIIIDSSGVHQNKINGGSTQKGDILHPRVQETFPKHLIEID